MYKNRTGSEHIAKKGEIGSHIFLSCQSAVIIRTFRAAILQNTKSENFSFLYPGFTHITDHYN